MKVNLLQLIITGILFNISYAQEIVNLPYDKIDGIDYQIKEREYYSEEWKTTVVTNTQQPSMMVFQPSEDMKNGTSVIVAPGGALYALSINSEGRDVANWLVSKGITAFVLKYHLVPSGKNGVKDLSELWGTDPESMYQKVNKVLPFSIQDGLNAVKYVREHAEGYKLDPQRIGFMGFSAGGAVVMGVGYGYDEKNRPDFLVPIYPWTDAMPVQAAPENSPPVLIICASDDGLGLANGAIELYKSYLDSKQNIALHMYSKGGHGFGMRTQGLPSDHWIERFYDWAITESLVKLSR